MKFRFIKMETQDNKWLTFNPSKQRLLRLIKKHNPKNVYVSVNQWVRYKEQNRTYPNLVLKEYGFIDIDGQNFTNKEVCRQYFEDINKVLSDIHIISRVRTNNTIGGYQILTCPCCLNKFRELLKNPIFDKTDRNVYDLKRVRRLTGSFNGNRSSWACDVDSTGHPKPQGLNSLNLEDCYTSGMPKADDSKDVLTDLTSPNKIKGRQAIRSKLPAHFLVKQISNSCSGVSNLYVPVLKFRRMPHQKYLLNLQKAYNLGDLYIFRYHMGFSVISPKTSQFGRLIKIYKHLGQRNLKSYNELVKFKQNFMCTSDLFDLDKLCEVNTFKFIGVMEQACGGSYSRPHITWLQKYYKGHYSNLIGDSNPKFSVGIFHS